MSANADAPEPYDADAMADFDLGDYELEHAEPEQGDEDYVCPCSDLEVEGAGLMRCRQCGERYGDEDDVPFETTARSRTRARNHEREN